VPASSNPSLEVDIDVDAGVDAGRHVSDRVTMARMVVRAPPPLALAALAALGGCREAGESAAPPPPARAAVAAPAPAARTLRYAFMAEGQPWGNAELTIRPDGGRAFEVTVVENGRGPRIHGTLRYRRDGMLAAVDIAGEDELGQDAAETFSLDGARAAWRSRAEAGQRALAAPAYYDTVAELPEVLGGMVRALERRGGRLPILPDGEVRLEPLGERSVSLGDERQSVRGHAVLGLGLPPTFVWTDDKGELFALPSRFASWVRKGWTGALPALLEAQDRFMEKRLLDIARRVAHHPPPAGLALIHARVLAPSGRAWLADRTVLIAGERIAAIAPSDAVAPPAGAEVVDLHGQAVLPGLWDMHAHLGALHGALHLAAGVTTVRDMGNDPDELDGYFERFADGSEVGPRILRAGFIEGRGPQAAAARITAETADEARAAVDFYARRGYEQIKIYSSIRPQLVPILAREAHARGMGVTGHVPDGMFASDAIAAGFDQITHLHMLFPELVDARARRDSIPIDLATGLDLRSRAVRRMTRLLLRRKISVDPTVAVYGDLILARAGQLSPGAATFAARLPATERRFLRLGGLARSAGDLAAARDSFRRALGLVAHLHRAGVPIVAGTDSFPGFMLHREIELYAEAGLAPWQAIRAATAVPAHLMQQDGSGVLAAGNDADLIVVDGDPLARIGDIDRVVDTVRAGVLYRSAELYGAIGVAVAPPE